MDHSDWDLNVSKQTTLLKSIKFWHVLFHEIKLIEMTQI